MLKPSSFGGRFMDRFIDFETVPDGDTGPAAPPAADPPAAPEGWQGPSQDEWASVAGAVQTLAQLEQSRASIYQPPANQPNVPPVPDPWADDYPEQLEAYVNHRVAPFQQYVQQQDSQRGTEAAKAYLDEQASEGGDFDRDIAMMRAHQLMPQMQARYGYTPKAAEEALAQAAKDQRAWEKARADAAVSAHQNHLETLSGAPGEPGTTYMQGVQQRTMPNYRDGGSVAARFFGETADRQP